MVGFSTPEGGSPVYARVLSDGTLRALAVLTALETHGNGQRLILEEFDNGIHPSRVSILTEAIFDCSKRHNIHVIATTHNPATLNALTPEQLDSVILTVHDHETHNAKLLPLRELPGYIDFIEQGRLGDLVTQRVYEKHLVPDYEKRRAERIQKSFANLP
jgi:predicted ATPase